MIMSPRSLGSFDTVYSACSIECDPLPNANDDVDQRLNQDQQQLDHVTNRTCVIGTYQIFKRGRMATPPGVVEDPKEGTEPSNEEMTDDQHSTAIERKGRLYVTNLSNNKHIGSTDESKIDIDITQQIDTDAILDMKWSSQLINGQKQLAVADSKGKITMYSVDDKQHLSVSQVVQCADKDTLCLSLDWSNRGLDKQSSSIVVSLSDGSICTIESNSINSKSDYQVTKRWKAHDYEPWIAAYDCWDSSHNTIWTGGDDLKVKRWDQRMITSNLSTNEKDQNQIQLNVEPTLINKKFEGGVTTIQSHALKQHILAVGSYDAQLRIFDTRYMKDAVSTFDAGGGIWRLKWHPTQSERILIASMHDGFKVVDIDSLNNSTLNLSVLESKSNSQERLNDISLVARFDQHESLAYGVDWSWGLQDVQKRDVITSCSFYDHLMHVWSV
ncbi:hypothetical protein OIO90_000914 [Microbotryomycetes sp. JL221]|nr:hypothetical protein OIO90_000914 [Microbotryomycetes sp. JL221]